MTLTDDELYVVRSKLKQLSHTDKPTSAPKPNSKNKEQNPLALLQQKVSSGFEEVLTYPEPTCTKQKSHPNKVKEHLVCLNTYQATR